MKKLLTILSAVGIVASSSTSVVSCYKKTEIINFSSIKDITTESWGRTGFGTSIVFDDGDEPKDKNFVNPFVSLDAIQSQFNDANQPYRTSIYQIALSPFNNFLSGLEVIEKSNPTILVLESTNVMTKTKRSALNLTIQFKDGNVLSNKLNLSVYFSSQGYQFYAPVINGRPKPFESSYDVLEVNNLLSIALYQRGKWAFQTNGLAKDDREKRKSEIINDNSFRNFTETLLNSYVNNLEVQSFVPGWGKKDSPKRYSSLKDQVRKGTNWFAAMQQLDYLLTEWATQTIDDNVGKNGIIKKKEDITKNLFSINYLVKANMALPTNQWQWVQNDKTSVTIEYQDLGLWLKLDVQNQTPKGVNNN